VHRARVAWITTNRALLRASPDVRMRERRQRFDELMRSANRAIAVRLREDRGRLRALTGQLQALDPLRILARGYAALTDVETGQVISTTGAARRGARLRAQVSDGAFTVIVEES
jgi:exodeoxyribonuclease VII large subunit